MERTEIVSLYKNTPADGTVVTVCGWAKNIRDSKNIGFIDFTKEMHSGLPESRQDAGWHRIFVVRQSLLSAGILGVFQAR